MKSILALLIVSFTITVNAREFIVAMPQSFASATDRANALRGVLRFVLEQSAPGDTTRVINGWEQMEVTTFRVPTGKIFDGQPEARLSRLKAEIAALIKFVNQAPIQPEEFRGSINLPRFLDFVSQIANGSKPTVIVLANPFYVDAADKTLNSRKSYFSDGYIMAESSRSLLSTTQKRTALDGVHVHYGYFTNSFVNALHEEKTKRFWSLYIGSQKGVLATFLADIGIVFQRAKEGISTPCTQATFDLADTALEVRSANPAPASLPQPIAPPVAAPIVEVPKPPVPTVEPVPNPAPLVAKATNRLPEPLVGKTKTEPEKEPTVVYRDRDRIIYVEAPSPEPPPTQPKVVIPVIPRERKGGEELMRMSEESSKPKSQ